MLKVLKHLKERSFQVSNSCDLLISLAYAYIVLPNSPFFFVCSASDPAFDSLLCSAVAQELHQEDGNSAMLKLVEGLFHFVPLRHCIGPGPRICNMVLKKIEKVKKAQWHPMAPIHPALEVVNKMMRSFVGSSVCHFLSNLHPFEHKIFLARHGESDLAA